MSRKHLIGATTAALLAVGAAALTFASRPDPAAAPCRRAEIARLRALGAAGPEALDALDTWVYAELFLTPRSDPWLGLVSPEVYAALPGDGIDGSAAR